VKWKGKSIDYLVATFCLEDKEILQEEGCDRDHEFEGELMICGLKFGGFTRGVKKGNLAENQEMLG